MHTEDDFPADEDLSSDATATSSDTGNVAMSGFEGPDTPLTPAFEVPSTDMDDKDSDATGELDLPDSFEDLSPHPAKSDPGFDGWLDGEDGEAASEDPYAELADEEDAAAEIADWMAFTGSGASTGSPEDGFEAAGSEPDEGVSSNDAVQPGESPVDDQTEDESHEDTIEFFLGRAGDDVAEAAEPDEMDESIEASGRPEHESADPETPGGDDATHVSGLSSETDAEDDTQASDPDELHVLPVVPITASPQSPGDDGDESDEDPTDEDTGEDTGEIPVVAATAAGEQSDGAIFDYEDDELTSEHYIHSATREHHELAAAVAAARAEDTEQVAVSAAIPGLESAVVGFADVVEAEDAGSAPVAKPPRSSDLFLRVGTGVALVLAFGLSLLWRPAIIVLALAAFVIAAGEFYSALIHRHYKPLSIFGFLGIVGAGLGTVVWGVVAIPIAFALMITVLLLFDAVSRKRQSAVSGFGLTILVAVWIGGFGAFAFPIIASDDYRALVLTVVAMVALVDIAAYGVGRAIGRRPFAPTISPKKTIEGFLGGTFMALIAGSVASFFVVAIDLPAGLVLGVVVAIFAPLGDLAVSVAKRSLDIKDMGSILPGHGGLLDRIDAIIAVIPAAWAALMWLGIL